MELKKGDIVAVVAEVVAERDGKIIISIPGATVSEDLIIAPRKPIKILDRSPSPGDEVFYKGDIRCIFRRNETQSVVSLVRDGMPHDDPTSYLFANIRDIRRVDQSGTVKFVSADKQVPNSETGREVMEELNSGSATVDDEKASSDDGDQQDQKDTDSGNSSESSLSANAVALVSAEAVQNNSADHDEVHSAQSPEHASYEVDMTATSGQEDGAESDSVEPEDQIEDEPELESDKITIEMPEGFSPRVSSALVEQEVLPPLETPESVVETAEASEEATAEADKEDVVPDAASDDDGDDDTGVDVVAYAADDIDTDDVIAAEAIEETPQEPVNEPEQPEMTEEEREEKERRLQKLRDQTLPQLNSVPEDKGGDIYDDIEDLDKN